MTQYRNTVRDLVHWALRDRAAADAVISGARLDDLPRDRREPVPEDLHGSYRRLDQALEQIHVDGVYRVGTSLAAALTEPARLAAVAGACATDDDAANDETCLTAFIQRFGARVLRRPPDTDEMAFYRSVYGADTKALPAAYADVIAVMLNSAPFLYFVEQGEQEVVGKPGVYELSSYELASRLSYHFWQTLPDDELWEIAKDGSLLEPSVYLRQVERLSADARARATMAEFFSDWLRVEDLPPLDANNENPLFAAFAAGDLPDPALRQDMIDEVLDLVRLLHVDRAGRRAGAFHERALFRQKPRTGGNLRCRALGRSLVTPALAGRRARRLAHPRACSWPLAPPIPVRS